MSIIRQAKKSQAPVKGLAEKKGGHMKTKYACRGGIRTRTTRRMRPVSKPLLYPA